MPMIGEIRMFGFEQPPDPSVWVLCDGRELPINQNASLFSILGTRFGGDGLATFAVPDLRGRVPIHTGSGFALGDSGGEEQHSLTVAETPAHTHVLNASTAAATSSSPAGNIPATASASLGDVYGAGNQPAAMNAGMLTATGNGARHENMQPFTVVAFMIAISGFFPTSS